MNNYQDDDHIKLKQACTLYCGKIQADFCEEKNLSICPVALKNWNEKQKLEENKCQKD